MALRPSRKILLFLIAFVGSGPAQSTGDLKHSTAQEPSSETASDYSREPFIYQYLHSFMRYENDGTGSMEIQGSLRVNTPAGLDRAGQLIFGYNSANERLVVRKVQVIKADGRVISAGPEAVQDLSSPVERVAPMYTDARQKHVTVPGLEVGDRVDYDVANVTFRPLMPGQFWQTWRFNDDSICLDEQVELNVPRNRPLKIKSPTGVEPTLREEKDRRIYHWATSTLVHRDAADIFKNFTFDLPTLLEGARLPPARNVLFSTFQSWAEVGRWYAELEKDRRMPTPEIHTLAQSIVKGEPTDTGKVQALYDWVSRNIRYVSLSFGVGRYQPHAAGEVLANRYGDCKDKTTLLEVLLESEGFHGEAVLIGSAADLDPSVPTPLQFDHAITVVKIAGEDKWLDSTVGVGPFGYLLPRLRGKDALVVSTEAPPAIRKTPSELPAGAAYNLLIKGAVNENWILDGTISLETRGDLEVLLRLGFLRMSPDQVLSMAKRSVGESKIRSDGRFSIDDLKTGDPLDIAKPFHTEVHVHGGVGNLGDQNSSLPGTLGYLVPSFSGFREQLLSLFPENGQLGGPKQYSLDIAIKLPEADHKRWKPEHLHITRDFAEYESDVSWEGNQVHAWWKLKLLQSEVPDTQKADYRTFSKNVTDSLFGLATPARKPPASNATVVPFSPRPEMPPAKVNELFKQGLAEVEGGSWGNAEKLMQQVVDLDPAFAPAWNDLGRAQIYLHKYAEGELTFRKYLALKPDDALPYAQLAWALTLQKKYSDAAELLEKRVASASNDGDAYRRLGLAYLLMHRPEPAVKALEKGAALIPKNESVHFYLGQACLQAHRNDEAVAAFERSLAIKRTDTKLNDAAYELSKQKAYLDRAEEWSKSSIDEVETELNQITLQTAQPGTSVLLRKVAMYWDTLGWIKFQKNDLHAAEQYVRAGWELVDDTTIGAHLGKIHEAEGHKDQAIEVYAHTVLAIPGTREMTDEEKEARRRLGEMLGGDSIVDARLKASRIRARDRRSIQVDNNAAAEGIAEYRVMIGSDAKLTDIQAVAPGAELDKVADSLRGLTMPQSFPDRTLQSLPRSGILACAGANQPCKFTLMSAGASERSFSSTAD